MKKLLPLMQREWLQHRFGWALLAGIPLGLALLAATFGDIHFDAEEVTAMGNGLPVVVAMACMVGAMGLMAVIATISSLIIATGIARRDHNDRSIEFWMSMPATHSESLVAPLIVHLLLVPAAALLVGLAGGWLLSLVAVGRVAGLGAWLALPWPVILGATLSMAARLVAGLPLAMLWLLPLTLLVVLMTAYFRRWGWVILAVGIGVGSQLLKRVFGQPLLSELFNNQLRHAAEAMVATPGGFTSKQPGDAAEALAGVPGWALHDAGVAFGNLLSPAFFGGLVFAGACFALLVLWRQRGAGGTA